MSLRDDAIAIWTAGIAAVDSAKSVEQQIRVQQDQLWIADVRIQMPPAGRIEVVGAGKAGAGMASGIEAALLSTNVADRISGWVNVPADCVRQLKCIHLHAARPAGLNEPTQEAVQGTQEILRRVQSLSESDICIVLLSGGASALLCSPAPGISLSDKLSVTRALAASGAPIQELNLVRTQLSQVKGGRLAAACRAGTLVALIISDVIGDPLEVIGSGPTTPSVSRCRLMHCRFCGTENCSIGYRRRSSTFLNDRRRRLTPPAWTLNFRGHAPWSIGLSPATRWRSMPRP